MSDDTPSPLNALLDAEADRLCNAQRYERSAARRDTRAQTFETAIIERYRRRESSVEEALIEMYTAGVSVRRVEDITEALWGTRVSPSTPWSRTRPLAERPSRRASTSREWLGCPADAAWPTGRN
jgi:Transposase, Mutator family